MTTRTLKDQPIFQAQALVDEKPAEEPAQAAPPNQIIVNKPPAGRTYEIQAQTAPVYAINFDPTEAQVLIRGQDLVLLFADGGQIVFQNLVGLAQIGQAPFLQVGGTAIGGAVILAQAEALAVQPDGRGPPTLETAAGGRGPPGGGVSEYQDDLGSLIEGLDPLGPNPFVGPAGGAGAATDDPQVIDDVESIVAPPIAIADTVITRSDTTLINDEWLVFNDIDPQGDRLVVSEVSNPINGAVAGGSAEGVTTFDFDTDGDGTTGSFQYRAQDLSQESAAATVGLTRQAIGDLVGADGDEILIGDGGTDLIFGAAGRDVLVGNGGADTLDGGAGADLLVGGTGADRFKLTDTGNADLIADLTLGEDVVDLADLLTDFDAGEDINLFVEFDLDSDGLGVDVSGSGNFTTVANLAFDVTSNQILDVVTDQDGNQVQVESS